MTTYTSIQYNNGVRSEYTSTAVKSKSNPEQLKAQRSATDGRRRERYKSARIIRVTCARNEKSFVSIWPWFVLFPFGVLVFVYLWRMYVLILYLSSR